MAQVQGSILLRHIRKVVAAQCPSQQKDQDLLQRFLADSDEAAFAALVQRHGAMVLGVCRSALHHQQDAEDVFQATFLVLARKARSIRKQQALSSWLHGVAYRLALKAKAQASRRQAREMEAASQLSTSTTDDRTWRELRAILHEELHRLPGKYRAPLLLCYWEGKTRDEAADQLGLTRGTFKDRLERGRNLLRSRLTGRGLVPTAALVATLFSHHVAEAGVAGLLTSATVKAALTFAAGKGASAGAQAITAVALAEGVIRAMHLTKLAMTILVVLVLGVGTGLGLLTGLQAGQSNGQGAPDPKALNDKTGKPIPADRQADDLQQGGVTAQSKQAVDDKQFRRRLEDLDKRLEELAKFPKDNHLRIELLMEAVRFYRKRVDALEEQLRQEKPIERVKEVLPPSLRIEHVHEHAFGKAGTSRVGTLSGQGVKALTAYLLVYSKGKAERVSEIRCNWDGSSPPLTAQMAFWDQAGQPIGAAGKRLPSLSLTFRAGAPDKKTETHTGRLIPDPQGGRSSMNYDVTGTAVSARTTVWVEHLHIEPMRLLKTGEIHSEWVGGRSEEDMIQASREGRVVFAVMLEWKK
jgi:RNA polymerase sigma factor (sigma-70 family)